MQNKPNLLDTQINVTSVLIKNYEHNPPFSPAKANPKQTQFNPKQTQFNPISNPTKPNQTQFKPNLVEQDRQGVSIDD